VINIYQLSLNPELDGSICDCKGSFLLFLFPSFWSWSEDWTQNFSN